MPSENMQSQSHRPSLAGHRSTSSMNSQTDSPSSTPPQHAKTKAQKHVVGGGGGRAHARVPSSKSIQKLAKAAHFNDGSSENLKKLGRNASATHLKKNHSHVSLKRNQSSSDVSKRPKSSHGPTKRPSSVHFEIGGQQEQELEPEPEDAWEEASSTASPALSRSASRPNSAKQSASNSQPESPSESFKPPPAAAPANGSQSTRHPTADAKIITERLLQRTPSHNTTKMSLTTATPATVTTTRPTSDSLENSQGDGPNSNGTSQFGSKEEVVSRFVSGSGTPSESQHFLLNRKATEPKNQEEMKRAQSMGNLTRRDSSEERALAPRSRKSSTSGAYVPPQQSRTQQKLWLQRASSNIEPQQMTPGVAINGLSNLHGTIGVTPLLGAGYDGRDPRIKQQLERTGLEYLVVRRHQDPVGMALKRLSQLPGADKTRRIPPKKGERRGFQLGLSQSLKDARRDENAGARSSYGSQGDASGRGEEDDGVSAILRSLWEKNFDFSSSAD